MLGMTKAHCSDIVNEKKKEMNMHERLAKAEKARGNTYEYKKHTQIVERLKEEIAFHESYYRHLSK